MTTFVREQARVCERCRRCDVSTRRVDVLWDGGRQATQLLCRWCRRDLGTALNQFMRAASEVEPA